MNEIYQTKSQLLEVINIQSEIAKLGLDLGQVMQLVVEKVLSLLNADGAVIELSEDDDMVYRAASVTQPLKMVNTSTSPSALRCPLQRGRNH